MTRLLIFIAAYTFSVHVGASQGIAGLWGREEWNCGGRRCTSHDIRLGVAQRIFEGFRIETSGTKACGIWYSHSGKIYRGFLVGSARDDGMLLSFGQEIDHNPSFYSATSFSELPNLKVERTEMVTLVASQLVRAPIPPDSTLPGLPPFHQLSRAEQVRWGLQRHSQWEKEYLAACLKEA